MSATARKEVFDSEGVGVYHCWSRCVRRAYLCGWDAFTGKDYSYRKEWVRDRLKQLAGVMAVDVLGYAVLDNHLHTVLRNRPDLVELWSDEQVVERWWHLCPDRREADGSPAEPYPCEISLLLSDPQSVTELRRRLSDISWFMRLLCQPIARRANQEDDVTGRFFAHRFGCERILDEAGLVASSIYVDLNPIRAGVAQTPEDSQYTSAFDRMIGRWQRSQRDVGELTQQGLPEPDQDAWLAPVFLDERSAAADTAPLQLHGGSPQSPPNQSPPYNPFPSARLSNWGFLPMDLDQYLELLDWTGRQLRCDKRGAIPDHLAPILERLEVRPERWVETIHGFPRLFRTAIGRAASVRQQAAQMGRRWLQGVRNCSAAFT